MKRRNRHDHVGSTRRSASAVVKPGPWRWLAPVLLAAFGLVGVVTLAAWLIPTPRQANVDVVAANAPDASGWQVGMLRADGLRIAVSGRSDASAVLDAERFSRPEVRHGYQVAAKIPALLNWLYCWCGCENRGIHRSNLQCFEDRMAEDCPVCLGTAEMAHEMSEKGISDAATIQAAVDVRWGPGR